MFILDKTNGNLRLNTSNPDLQGVLGTHTLQIEVIISLRK